MKKLLLILLCLPMVGFTQSDESLLGDGFGDYFKTYGNPKAKGLEFKIKIPLGYAIKEEGEESNLELQALELHASQEKHQVSKMNYEKIQSVHGGVLGHMGVNKTTNAILKKHHKWSSIRKDVKHFIKNCYINILMIILWLDLFQNVLHGIKIILNMINQHGSKELKNKK